jgi:aldose 1-epimerase
MSRVTLFGTADGEDVHEVVIGSTSGVRARILTYGATLREVVVPASEGSRSVVLGLDTLEAYRAQTMYLGAVPGRYANRIGGATFDLRGQTYHLDANEGENQLHGGPESFGRRNWALIDNRPDSATFAIVSPDGDMGYPGRVVATCTYAVAGDTLRVVFEAFSDRPTPLNLTTHAYFNLDGSADIRDHTIMIAADFVTQVGDGLVPTGEIVRVAGTPYDLLQPTPIRDGGILYDTNFVLRRNSDGLSHAATLHSNVSGLEMQLWTTEPGLQFYDGHLINWPALGWKPHAGLCLEPQRFPDSPNKAHFPATILEPGKVSRQASELRFALVTEP